MTGSEREISAWNLAARQVSEERRSGRNTLRYSADRSMYPWYRDSVAAAAAAGLGGPVGVVGSGFCSTGPGQGGTTIKTESGYSDCMLALDYVQSKVSDVPTLPTYFLSSFRSYARVLHALASPSPLAKVRATLRIV